MNSYELPPLMKKPDFEQMSRVLARGVPQRPVLFDLFMNNTLYERLTGEPCPADADWKVRTGWVARAFAAAGYDYVTTHASAFSFAKHRRAQIKTLSLNDSENMTTWEAFESYSWDDPGSYSTDHYASLEGVLPEGMKYMVMGPGGVLENIISLVGYEELCYLIYEEPDLVAAISDKVGSLLLKYYEAIVGYDSVGFICSNDDWGFKTQTFLSPDDMRKYIFPWHKKIVRLAHEHGKPVMLHSCGQYRRVLDDVIDDIGFDARHSYEDTIVPVEEAYEEYNGRIAVLGGLDMNFLCTSDVAAVRARAEAMLERTKTRGAYALGTGNSVPEYIPWPSYRAILEAAQAYGR